MLDNRMAEAAEELVESPATEEPEEVETPAEETPEIAKENAEEPKQEEPQEEPREEIPEEPKGEPQKQPTRAEKKIRNLWQENAQLKQQLDAFKQKQTLEFEDGEIDAATLDKVIAEKAIEAAKLMVASQNVDQELKVQAREWADDLETIIGQNPELDPKSPEFDKDLSDALAKALSDSQGNARFDLKASELIGAFKKRQTQVVTKAKEEGKSEVTASLARQSQEGAITPSPKASKTEEYTEDEIERIQQTNPRLYTDLVMKGKI